MELTFSGKGMRVNDSCVQGERLERPSAGLSMRFDSPAGCFGVAVSSATPLEKSPCGR